MGRFDGQVALITGGARGMGRSHALALAREGADIALLDVCQDLPTVGYPLATASDLDDTAHLVEQHGRRVWTYRSDVRDFDAVVSAVDAVAEAAGRLDILVAKAGISAGDPVQTADPAQ